MPREKIYHPASDCYDSAWKSCSALWPVFLIQLVFLILQYAVFFLLVFILAGPFIEKNWDFIGEGLKNPNGYDWSGLGSLAEGYFWNLDWILLALGAGTLYMLWWSLLSAFSNGGIYRAFWRNLEKGSAFSWNGFLKDGANFLLRFLFLQTLLMAVTFVLFMGFLLFVSIGAFLAGFLFAHSAVIGFLLFLGAIPLGLSLFLLLLGFWAYVFLWMGEMTREKSEGLGWAESLRAAWDSMWESAKRFRENRWRTGIGLTVACLVYFIASLATRFVLGLLGHLPVIGILFDLLDLGVASAMVVLFLTYLPALSVAYLGEKEM